MMLASRERGERKGGPYKLPYGGGLAPRGLPGCLEKRVLEMSALPTKGGASLRGPVSRWSAVAQWGHFLCRCPYVPAGTRETWPSCLLRAGGNSGWKGRWAGGLQRCPPVGLDVLLGQRETDAP